MSGGSGNAGGGGRQPGLPGRGLGAGRGAGRILQGLYRGARQAGAAPGAARRLVTRRLGA